MAKAKTKSPRKSPRSPTTGKNAAYIPCTNCGRSTRGVGPAAIHAKHCQKKQPVINIGGNQERVFWVFDGLQAGHITAAQARALLVVR